MKYLLYFCGLCLLTLTGCHQPVYETSEPGSGSGQFDSSSADNAPNAWAPGSTYTYNGFGSQTGESLVISYSATTVNSISAIQEDWVWSDGTPSYQLIYAVGIDLNIYILEENGTQPSSLTQIYPTALWLTLGSSWSINYPTGWSSTMTVNSLSATAPNEGGTNYTQTTEVSGASSFTFYHDSNRQLAEIEYGTTGGYFLTSVATSIIANG